MATPSIKIYNAATGQWIFVASGTGSGGTSGGGGGGTLPTSYTAPDKTTVAITLQGAAGVGSTDADVMSVFDGKAGTTGAKTFWLNERGNPRTRAADNNEPAMRIIQATAAQAANLLEVNDYTNAVQLVRVSGTGTLIANAGLRVTNGTLGSGRVLTSDASGNGTWQLPAGGGGALQARTTASLTTSGLATGASQATTITMANGYRLYRVTCSAPSRVRLYSTTAKRDADAARAAGAYPSGDHGLVFEYTAGSGLLGMDITPAVEGFDMAASPTGAIPITVTNTGVTTTTITVTFDWVRSE